MDLKDYKHNLESWFCDRPQSDFPDTFDYVSVYKAVIAKLKPIHSQVNAGADFTDGTTLTRHDKSHIARVVKQASKMLSYENASVTAFEAFVLLVAIQIHDIKNIEGRDGHENNAIQIFDDLDIGGIMDRFLLKEIGNIASCHAGSFSRESRKEKDKIGYLLGTHKYTGEKKIRPQFLAAILRLADEYADDNERAMSYLIKLGKVSPTSIIHQMHAESLYDVEIAANTGIVEFDYHIDVKAAINKYPKYDKENDTVKDVYLLDEIFERTIKSHYETLYCMRFLRSEIPITKLKVSIELENVKITEQLIISYELAEMGYPNDGLSLIDLCGKDIKINGHYWSGENLKNHIVDNIEIQ